MHDTDCLICGHPLIYDLKLVARTCMICGKEEDSNASCESGHFICDTCHGADAMDLIEAICLSYSGTNAIELAQELMQMKNIKMHGPEHHFLVPAVLLTVYYNQGHQHDLLQGKLGQAKKRAQKILGGFCGYYGTCGAAVGSGLAISLITDTTPLSTDTWKLCNMMTAKSLTRVAKYNGPRCCKRDTYLSLIEGIQFLMNEFKVKLPIQEISCIFHKNNRECLKNECKFHPELNINQPSS